MYCLTSVSKRFKTNGRRLLNGMKKNISLETYFLLPKTLKGNKIATIKFLKNLSFGMDFKQLVQPLLYKINRHKKVA